MKLEQVAHELSFRSSSAAILLQEEVQDRLDALRSFGGEKPQSLRETPEEEIWRLRQEVERERSCVLQLRRQLEDERASRPSAEEVGRLLLQLAEERRARADLAEEGIALRQKIEALSSQTTGRDEILRLRRQLAEAREKLRLTEAEADKLRTQAKAARSGGRGSTTYAKVFLAPEVPTWLLSPLHKFFKKNLHPDVSGDADKNLANERFREMQAAFEAIARERGVTLS